MLEVSNRCQYFFIRDGLVQELFIHGQTQPICMAKDTQERGKKIRIFHRIFKYGQFWVEWIILCLPGKAEAARSESIDSNNFRSLIFLKNFVKNETYFTDTLINLLRIFFRTEL